MLRIKWCDSYRVERDLEGVDGPQRVGKISEGVITAAAKSSDHLRTDF